MKEVVVLASISITHKDFDGWAWSTFARTMLRRVWLVPVCDGRGRFWAGLYNSHVVCAFEAASWSPPFLVFSGVSDYSFESIRVLKTLCEANRR